MADYEIFANSDADMQTTLNTLNTPHKDGRTPANIRYSVNYYGKKYTYTGATTTNANGLIVRTATAQPGVYAILRWQSPSPCPPPGLTFPAGVTFSTLDPATSPVVFA